MSLLKNHIVCIVLSLVYSYGYSQRTIQYNIENGLPSNHIYQIEQDEDGFMWFGTNAGIVKFDGHEFKTFTTQNGLPSNDIWRIEARPDGKIWYFAKSKRLGYIHRDTVYAFPIETGMIPHIPQFIINKYDVEFMGRMNDHIGHYIKLSGSQWKVFYSIDVPKFHKIFTVPIPLPDGRKIDRPENKNTLYDKNNRFLYDFNATDRDLKLISKMKSGISKNFFYTEKQLYFSLYPGIVIVYDLINRTVIAKRIFNEKHPYMSGTPTYPEIQEYKDHFQISQMDEWVEVDQNLLVLERRKFNTQSPPVHIFKDSRENFWLAGNDFGLIVYPKSHVDNWYHFQGKKVQSVNFLNGKLVVNVLDEGWYVREEPTGEFKLIIPNIGKIYGEGYHSRLKTYYFYNNNSFWYGKSLYKIKRVSNMTLKNMHTLAGAKCVIETPNGYKISHASSLADVDSNFVTVQDGYDLYMTGINKIIDFNGAIYAAGGDGIEVYGKGYPKQNIRHPLLQIPINTLSVYNKDYLLVGTDGFGAYFYDGKDKVFPIKGTEGFSVNGIIVYGDDLWMATAKGIHQFKKSMSGYSLSHSIYDEDGLPDNFVNGIYIHNNILYAATDDGLTQINLFPDKYAKSIKPYFLGNRFFDKKNNTYTVSYGYNITLPFGILGLPSQEYVKYYYRTSTNDPWLPTNTTTLIMGKQVPGKYEISLKAVDQHGNTGQKDITLIVLPLWYQTILAKTAAVVILLLIVVSVTLFFRKRIEQKKKAELELNKTLSELELKALRSQMNPHFVFNSLNAIQYFIVKNKAELSEEYLAKFSRLVRLFFEYSKYDALKFSQEVDLLRRYLEIEKIRFEDKLEYDIVIDEAIEDDDIEVPSMILQPIVENAVNHGIFHKKGGGTVKIVFKKTGDFSMLISIEDNGVGILAMKEIQRDTYGNYRSKSSEVIRERLKILSENKNTRWKIDYKIMDRSQIDRSMNGTLVEIHIMFMNDKI